MNSAQKLSEAFLSRSVRERVWMMLAGLFLLLYGGWYLLLGPSVTALQALQAEHGRKVSQGHGLQQQLSELLAANIDPDAPLNQRIDALLMEQDALRQTLAEQTGQLIPAKRMKEVLQQLLAKHPELKLIELSSQPPVSVMNQKMASSELSLYQQGLVLVVEGRYFAIQEYLQHLQSLPWQFYWQSFDYEVADYPKARLRLELYTLSTGKAFVGV
ncbi:type II secretion system protein GspM [Bowmanella pacifica]|uniref:MSHA biogenesis protein MshJ n=1 Tax=Bowmanella pacifica TaxID=502051 RepID=A0A918DLC1_9ALTE|nr:type II secretion system protein GspM [Bowmanella pacifica]GGO71346.1 MSHA biogenesis protein MshJ [Bowmanella pacifica]